jgi:hypothetical protein
MKKTERKQFENHFVCKNNLQKVHLLIDACIMTESNRLRSFFSSTQIPRCLLAGCCLALKWPLLSFLSSSLSLCVHPLNACILVRPE